VATAFTLFHWNLGYTVGRGFAPVLIADGCV
jgi:hypothetical protein